MQAAQAATARKQGVIVGPIDDEVATLNESGTQICAIQGSADDCGNLEDETTDSKHLNGASYRLDPLPGAAGSVVDPANETRVEVEWMSASDDSDTDEEFQARSNVRAERWAQGIILYFCDGLDSTPDDFRESHTECFWRAMGACIVHERSKCTHLVLDHVKVGHLERDERIAKDLRWAKENSIGE